MNLTLSSLKEKVDTAQCPLPLFTCLHVKPDVSELMFAGKKYSFIIFPQNLELNFLMIYFFFF